MAVVRETSCTPSLHRKVLGPSTLLVEKWKESSLAKNICINRHLPLQDLVLPDQLQNSNMAYTGEFRPHLISVQ